MGDNEEKRVHLEVNEYIKIKILGYVKTSPDSICGIHSHPFWELIYTKEGEGIHQIGEDELTLGKNTVCLISPDTLHDCRNDQKNENMKLYIGFSYQYSFSAGTKMPYYLLSDLCQGEIKIQFDRLCDLFDREEAGVDKVNIGEVISIIGKVVPGISKKDHCGNSIREIGNGKLVEQIKEYLGNNRCRMIRVSDLGAMFYLSSHYLGEIFKKFTGMSIKQYHNMLRMQYAYWLLEKAERSISEISTELGFESIHYFSRLFKEYYGFSPSQLRKK